MNNPKTIIEINHKFSQDEILELKKFIKNFYHIDEDEIEVFKEKNYIAESSFAQEIFETIIRDLNDINSIKEQREEN